MTRASQPAYLYYFTFAETGKRAHLGAYHGLELEFLSDSFPADWEHSREDENLSEAIRTYWVHFAKTGNPNGAGVPEWPAWNARSSQWMELGRTTQVAQVKPQLKALEQIMRQVLSVNSEPLSARKQ